MRNVWMLGLIGLAACSKDVDTDETDVIDTDVDDTDTEDTDVVDDGLFGLNGTLVIDADHDVPTGSIRVGFMPLTFPDEGVATFGAPLTESAVTGAAAGTSTAFELRISPEPDESLFVGVADGVELAPFGIGAYVDADGNGVRGPSDPFVGASNARIVAFLRGTIPVEWTTIGAMAGWNLIDLSLTDDGGPTRFVPVVDEGATDFYLDANLISVDRDGLALTVYAQSEGNSRVGLYDIAPLLSAENPPPADPLLLSVEADLSSSGARVTLPALPLPPADHYTADIGDMPEGVVEAAIYVGLAWDDLDDDGTFTGNDPEADTFLNWSIYGDDVQFVVHFVPLGYEAAVFPEVYGWPMGWSMIRGEGDGDPVVVDWASGLPIGSAL